MSSEILPTGASASGVSGTPKPAFRKSFSSLAERTLGPGFATTKSPSEIRASPDECAPRLSADRAAARARLPRYQCRVRRRMACTTASRRARRRAGVPGMTICFHNWQAPNRRAPHRRSGRARRRSRSTSCSHRGELLHACGARRLRVSPSRDRAADDEQCEAPLGHPRRLPRRRYFRTSVRAGCRGTSCRVASPTCSRIAATRRSRYRASSNRPRTIA